MTEQSYDVAVIGGGPAGYPAAIRAAQNGLQVVCVDEWRNLDGSRAFGGTCLNAGCIPSKALLESSELYHRAASEFKSHGISVGELSVDIGTMQKRKGRIVRQLTRGIEALFKSNGVTGVRGHGRLLGGGRVEVTDPDGNVSELSAGHVVIATGSTPAELSVAPFDGEHIVDSWGALEFESVPERLGVVGAGVVGLELGSVWQRLGAEVVILEALEEFLYMADEQIAGDALRHFRRQGLDIRLGANVQSAAVSDGAVEVKFQHGGEERTLEVDKLIVCVGRRPFTAGLLGDKSGVELDEKGFVKVDEQCRTTAPGVWAVGDVVRGPMLAHKGTEEGIMAADLIAGKIAEVNYDAIPSVIYTAPEIAWVGQTEAQLRSSGIDYKVGSFPFAANGRAKGMEQTAGLVKLLCAEEDDELLGVHIVGPVAGELIAEAVLAMEFCASGEDLQRTIHAHPTLTEAIHEASLAADNRAIHAINR